MTAIAYKDGYLAADSCISAGGVHVGSEVKVFCNVKGEMLAVCGAWFTAEKFIEWFNNDRVGPVPEVDEDSEAVIIETDGSCRMYHSKGSEWAEVPFGIGRFHFLNGAMAAGATAVEAVIAAAKVLDGCDFPVRVYKNGKLIRTIKQKTEIIYVEAD